MGVSSRSPKERQPDSSRSINSKNNISVSVQSIIKRDISTHIYCRNITIYHPNPLMRGCEVERATRHLNDMLTTFARQARRVLHAAPRRAFTASARSSSAEKDSIPTSENGTGLGSASPWSTFDAWGADEVRSFDPEQVRSHTTQRQFCSRILLFSVCVSPVTL